MPISLNPQLSYRHFDQIDSTNSYLMDSQQAINQLVSADIQHNGRGRRQQKWVDEGESLLFSLSTALPCGINVNAWPVQVAITLAQTIKTISQDKPFIKWPNDLYVKNQHNQLGKCAGILVESSIGKHNKIVTGVGMNLAPLKHAPKADYPVAHLSLLMDKQSAVICLGNALFEAWETFIQAPQVSPEIYHPYDMLANQTFIAFDNNTDEETIGIGMGINEQGELLVQQAGRITTLTSQQRIRLI